MGAGGGGGGGGLTPPPRVLECSSLSPARNSRRRSLFLSPTFVQTLATELAVDPVFGPILRGAGAALSRLVDRHGAPVNDPARTPKAGPWRDVSGAFGLIFRRGQGAADRLCIPAGGGLCAQVLRDCHHGPLGGHFWRTKMGSLLRRLAFWLGQDVDVAENLRSCHTRHRTKAEHGGPRGLLHPLLLPSRRGCMIGVNWIVRLADDGRSGRAAGFDIIQNHFNLLSVKGHAVPTRSTATATDAAMIIRDMRLRSGAGFPDALVVDRAAKFTSDVFRAFVKSTG